MLPFCRPTPKFEDHALHELALRIHSDNEHPTFLRELLAEKDLDFSLESLKKIDDYLTVVRKEPPEDADIYRVILRVGAYVGEVFRNHCPNDYHWLRYGEAIKVVKYLEYRENAISTCCVLWKPAISLVFPLDRVSRIIEGDGENNLFASVSDLLAKESREAATPARRAEKRMQKTMPRTSAEAYQG